MQRFGKFYDTHSVGVRVISGDFEGACDVIMRTKGDGEEQSGVQRAREKWTKRDREGDGNAIRKLAHNCGKDFNRWMMCEKTIMEKIARGKVSASERAVRTPEGPP